MWIAIIQVEEMPLWFYILAAIVIGFLLGTLWQVRSKWQARARKD